MKALPRALLEKKNIRNSVFIAAREHLRGFDTHTRRCSATMRETVEPLTP
jgi:hypothetical protein